MAQQLGWGCVGMAVVLACIVRTRSDSHFIFIWLHLPGGKSNSNQIVLTTWSRGRQIASPTNPAPPFPPLSTSSLPPPVPQLPPTTTLRLSILLTVSSLLSLSAFFVYNNRTVGNAVSVGVGLGNAALGVWGFWVGVFGFGGRKSNKTVSPGRVG